MSALKYTVVVLLLSVLAACGGGGGEAAKPEVLDISVHTACGHLDANKPLVFAGYNVNTNDWGVHGKNLLYAFTNCVKANNLTADSITATFEWSLPQIDNQTVFADIKAYNEIIYGRQLNGAASRGAKYPKVSAITDSLKAAYDVTITENGWSQTFFDIVFASAPDSNALTTDIAIQITKSPYVVRPTDPDYYQEATIGGAAYDVTVHLNKPPRFSVFFNAREDKLAGTINVKAFTDYLVKHNFLNPNDYLNSIEFGTEVISGVGKTVVNSFRVTP